MSTRQIRWALAVLLFSFLSSVCFFHGTLYGQTNLGRVVGTVRDATDAAVPGVTITVRNEGTGWLREFVTGDAGDYEVSNLVAGTYTVTAELPGFKRFVRPGIVLDAGRTVRIDAELQVGEVVEEVVVEARTPVVETDTSSISNAIDTNVVLKSVAASKFRPWEAFVMVPTFQAGTSKFTYSLAGARTAQAEFHIDGIASPSGGSSLGSTAMTLEGIGELKVQAVNNTAEYPQPGIYSMISRSGTNDFHGRLLYQHSNSALNARGFFAKGKGSGRTHNWALSLGGPLLLPGLYNGKNKTFFMVSYEGLLNPLHSFINATVPTRAMREGNFSAFSKSIRNPFTREPFPNNQISSHLLNPVSIKLQERFYPAPPDIFSRNNFSFPFDRTRHANNADLRIDHKISHNNTIYGRFGWIQFDNLIHRSALPAIGAWSQKRNLRTYVMSDTHTFNPRVINEFRIGYQRSDNPAHEPQSGLEVLSAAGIRGIRNVPDAFGMPQILISGVQNIAHGADNALTNVDQSDQLSDSLSWIRGRHSLKMGVDVRRQYPNNFTVPRGTYGQFDFIGFFTGDAYADFLLGLPRTSQRRFPSPASYLRQWEWGFFVQDDFKFSPRLTVQLGLRYDYQTPTSHLDNLLYNFDPASGQLALASSEAREFLSPFFNPEIPIVLASDVGFPDGQLWKSDTNNFAPRIGFAFRPTNSDDFVVRAGYGIFNDRLGHGVAGAFRGGPFTPGTQVFTNEISDGQARFQFPRPFPDLVTATGDKGPFTSPPSVNAVAADLRNPYVQQWNMTVEKGLFDVGLRASYIGTKGTNLIILRNINLPRPSTVKFSQDRRPYPLYRDIFLRENGGNSIYHALQLEAKRRYSALTFNLAYTWANTISDVEDGSDVGEAMENPFDRRAERGRENYAIQHRFVGYLLWEIPTGQGRQFLSDLPPVLDQILGGWDTTWTFFAQTGAWFNPTFSGPDPSNTRTTGGRPDRIGDGNLSNRTLEKWFDPSAFVIPKAGIGRFGNAGRNILEGPGFWVAHLSLGKEFRMYENVRLRLEMMATNVFNHPGDFQLPARDLNSPLVGQITGQSSSLMESTSRNIVMRLQLRW